MSRTGSTPEIAMHDWSPGPKLPKGEYLQQQVVAIRRLLEGVAYATAAQRGQIRFEWIGIVVDAGPDGQADYDDPRYWLKKQYVKTAGPSDNPEYADDTDLPSGLNPFVVTGINLDETDTGTHSLPVGKRVWVWSVKDAGDYSDPDNPVDPVVHYFFSCAAPGDAHVNLTRNGGANGVPNSSICSYTYDVYTRLADGTSGAQIGTACPVMSTDAARRFYVPVTAATEGFAFVDVDGLLKIKSCNETIGYGCAPTP